MDGGFRDWLKACSMAKIGATANRQVSEPKAARQEPPTLRTFKAAIASPVSCRLFSLRETTPLSGIPERPISRSKLQKAAIQSDAKIGREGDNL